MTKTEFGIFAAALKTYYPREKDLLPNDAAMKLWYKQLQDIPFPLLEAALDRWVTTNAEKGKYSPSIAEIRELSASIASGEIEGWGEAWEKVLDAVKKHGLYGQKQAMDSLDEITKKAVRGVGFRDICTSENISIERANFRTIYQELAQKEKERRQMSAELKSKIEAQSVQMIEAQNRALLEEGNRG